jgi:hypothetical protein
MLELVVVAGTVVAAACAYGARAGRRSAAARALDRYASSRGAHFAPAPAALPFASPRVLGSHEGVAYVLDLHRLSGQVRTRVSAEPRSHGPRLSVLQRGSFAVGRPAALVLGDGAFDEAYIVNDGSAADAEALRAIRRPLLVLAERRGVWLSADTAKIALSWLGVETHPRYVDAARDAVSTIATFHRPEAPYR